VLGVSSDATAVQLRDKFAEQEREIRESGLSPSERAQRGERLKQAYDQVSAGAQRVRVDFFLIDAQLGRRQAQAVADTVPKPDLALSEVIKPRKINVSHEALWEELDAFRREPPRVEGLQPRPLKTEVDYPLPPILAIQFDC
jgi:hypothetical protein